MKYKLSFILLLMSGIVVSQNLFDNQLVPHLIDLGKVTDNDDDFSNFDQLKEIWEDVDIVMLGEQSHGEKTAYQTKIKLIKFLHEEMGFDIIAFESGLYECNRAWGKIENGENVSKSLGQSVFYLWSITKSFEPLAAYIEANKNTERPLLVGGFDYQFTGRISEYEFTDDFKKWLAQTNPAAFQAPEWNDFEVALNRLVKYDMKKYKKDQARKDTVFVNTIITEINPSDPEAAFWRHVLGNVEYLLSDLVLKTDNRDRLMAENLIWLKEANPEKKIICWGATSHFLYNCDEVHLKGIPYNLLDNYYRKQSMMGQYVKDHFGDNAFIVGFIAYQGKYGLLGDKDLKPAKESSLSYQIEKSGLENCFLSFENYDPGSLISRPLGQKYMKNNISHVMNGVIFNKNMEDSRLDRNLFLEIYPENKWIKPEPVATTEN